MALGLLCVGAALTAKIEQERLAPNVAGGLVRLLAPFASHGVSMTKIESRPARLASMPGSWEYMFYVDVEGHRDDPGVAAALGELKSIAPYLKIFGSYPVGDY